MFQLLVTEINSRRRLIGFVLTAIIVLNFVLLPLHLEEFAANEEDLWQNLDLSASIIFDQSNAVEIIKKEGLWTGQQTIPDAVRVKKSTAIAQHEKVKLVAVIHKTGMRVAHLLQGNNNLLRVQEGEIIPGGVMVVAINPDHVVLRGKHSNTETRIYLYSPMQAAVKD